MDKIAQKRGPLTKLRETINAPTEKLMGVFSPEFIQLMDKLRDIDDAVRDEASGLKDLLKLAKTNFNRREYMTTISYLGQFHEKIETINNKFKELGKEVKIVHHGFLFGDMEPENIDYLKTKLGPRFEKRK